MFFRVNLIFNLTLLFLYASIKETLYKHKHEAGMDQAVLDQEGDMDTFNNRIYRITARNFI